MYYAVSIMALGYTRVNGVQAYNDATREFLEITPAQARKLIDEKFLKGLTWRNGDEGPEFVCDEEGWNQKDIPVKTACGKFRAYVNDLADVSHINSMFSLVRIIDTDYRGRLFEVVSNKCCRVKMTAEQLIELNKISNIAGVRIDEAGNISEYAGVVYQDRREKSEDDKIELTPGFMGVPDGNNDSDKKPQTLQDIFGDTSLNLEEQGEPEVEQAEVVPEVEQVEQPEKEESVQEVEQTEQPESVVEQAEKKEAVPEVEQTEQTEKATTKKKTSRSKKK